MSTHVPPATPSPRPGDEGGASLVLAVVFLFVVSLVLVGLVRWAGSDITNSSHFVLAQSVTSEANSGTNLAVQYVRYNFIDDSLDGATPAPCWDPPGTPSVTDLNDPNGNHAVASWCMTRWYPNASPSVPGDSLRIVTISTCPAAETATACASQPLLQAIVSIDDGSGACYPVANASSTPNTCGQSLTIAHWQFGPTPPSVTSVATGSFTCASGTPVLVGGTDLSLATHVDFVVSSTANTTDPVMAPAGSQTVVSDSTIQACAPSSLASYSLYVIVSTPMGTSSIGPSSLWSGG